MKMCDRGVFAILCLFTALPIYGQGVQDYGSLPRDRFPYGGWNVTGWANRGGWTQVDVTEAGIMPGGSDSAPVLESLANQASVPTVFYFPPGEYTFSSQVDIKNSNVIIRGAGSDQTRFILDGSGAHEIRFLGWNDDPVDILSSVEEGGRNLSIASTDGLEVGDLIEVSQEIPAWEAEWGIRSWGQLVFITSISGNQITVDLPLSLGLNGAANPRVEKIHAVENVGIEDIYIERRQYGESNNIEMRSVFNGFIRNVESYNAVKYHVLLYRCRQVEVSGSYIHDAQNYGSGGYGYGVNLENLSTNILVTNNIFKNLRHHILIQTGTNHSVISYNYNVDIVELVDLSLHGHFSNNNLYEGNIVWWAGFADYWGQVGPGNTLYRNRIMGKEDQGEGVVLYDNSDLQNVIGNDLQRNSFLSKDADVDLTYEEGNIIRGVSQWNELSSSADLPASLYLKEAPSFWGDRAWPPFGPDAVGSATNRIPAQDRYDSLIGKGPDPGGANQSPAVRIEAPAAGTNFLAGTSIQIDAAAQDADGTITNVEFYIDGVRRSTLFEAPYRYEWADAEVGTHILRAHAIDDLGTTTVSEEVVISVSREENGDVFVASVSASASREDAAPENTLDGDLYSRWAAHGEGQWIQYTLSAPATIASAGIAWVRGDSQKARFDIGVSMDGVQWIPLYEQAESSGFRSTIEYYDFEPIQVRYVRIIGYGTTSNAWNMISEVDLSVEALTPYMAGDVSGNGSISALDASLILSHSIGETVLEGQALFAADVTANGAVSALDASLILQFVTGLIPCFPADATCAGSGKIRALEANFRLPRIASRP